MTLTRRLTLVSTQDVTLRGRLRRPPWTQCHVAYVDYAAGLGFSCQMLIVAGARCRVLAGSPSFLTR
jgi:hypothetical protein